MSQPSNQAMNQVMNQFMYDILRFLQQHYMYDTKKFVHYNDLFTYFYNGYQRMGFLLNRNQFDAALEFLHSMNLIHVESAYYRLAPQGYMWILNPPPNYAALSLEAQKESNRIAQESNHIANESKQAADKANEISEHANKIAYLSVGIALLSFILSLFR